MWYSNARTCSSKSELPQVPRAPLDFRLAMTYSNVVINLIGSDTPTRNFSFEDVNVTGQDTFLSIHPEAPADFSLPSRSGEDRPNRKGVRSQVVRAHLAHQC